MPYKCPILLILDLPKNAGIELGAPDAIFMFTNIVCIEEIFT